MVDVVVIIGCVVCIGIIVPIFDIISRYVWIRVRKVADAVLVSIGTTEVINPAVTVRVGTRVGVVIVAVTVTVKASIHGYILSHVGREIITDGHG